MTTNAKPKRNKSPYCQRRNGIFVYRRDIPERWRKIIGQTRWKISLHTGNETEAARKARAIAVGHDATLERLERDGPVAYLRHKLDELEGERRSVVQQATRDAAHLRKLGVMPVEPASTGDVLREDLERLKDRMMRAAETHLATLDPADRVRIMEAGGLSQALAEMKTREANVRLFDAAREMASSNSWISDAPLPTGLTIDEQIAELGLRQHARQSHEEDKATLERLGKVLEPTGIIASTASKRIAPKGSADTISVVFDKWLASQGQRLETSRKWKTYQRRLVDVIGDKAVRSVTKSDIRQYVETIGLLPDAATLPPSARAGTVQSLLDWAEAEDEPKLITPATVGKHLDFCKAFFRWCSRQDYSDLNPAADIQAPKDTRTGDDMVRPFSRDELKTLVDAARTKWGPKDGRTFIILAAVFTGARLEEICQLAPGNLEDHGTFHAIRIDSKDGRQLKNEASRRVIPIPTALADTGFVQFAKAAKGQTIFGLTRVMGRYGRSFAYPFRRLREDADLADPRLRFHSLRHSYADLLRAKKVPDDASAQLMGHVGNRVRDGYGHGYDLETLYSWVNLLEPI